MSLTSLLFRAARVSATSRAIRRGRAPQRAANIVVGRVIARATRKVWR